MGWCHSDAGLHIASICRHMGEEPLITGKNGICNVFFSHCNLQCIFCQNHDISNNSSYPAKEINDLETALQKITALLDNGCNAVGFVSPTHFQPHVMMIIDELHRRNYHPVIVYNSNAYDDVQVLKNMENTVDVYLPDFKYLNKRISLFYSNAIDYPEFAKVSLKEMFRQKGDGLKLLNSYNAGSGLIIRHLVLPGSIDDSKNILRWIAENLSNKLHISLMSQYHPCSNAIDHPILCNALKMNDYEQVQDELFRLGFTNGWVQDTGSHEQYLPDFEKLSPFG